MLSKFGIFIRKIRNNESLRCMAKKLDITPAFLSSMEVGRRPIPNSYIDKIKDIYNLNELEYQELVNAVSETNNRVDIEIIEMNEAKKNTTMIFARKIINADNDLINKLKKILEEEE